MKYVIILMTLASSFRGFTQEVVPEMVTDRPDQTESSGIVPVRSLQIETGILMSKNRTEQSELNSVAYNTSLFRYGLLNNFELRLGFEYRREMETFSDTGSLFTTRGFSPLYLGFKTKITEEKGALPEIAFIGGVALPFTAAENFQTLHPSAIMRFAFSHTLTDRFSIGYNLGAEWESEVGPGYFYTAVIGIGLTQRWGMFAELFGLLSPENPNEHLLDAGFTCLVLPNLQLDVSGGMGLNVAATDYFVSAGLSFRMPR